MQRLATMHFTCLNKLRVYLSRVYYACAFYAKLVVFQFIDMCTALIHFYLCVWVISFKMRAWNGMLTFFVSLWAERGKNKGNTRANFLTFEGKTSSFPHLEPSFVIKAWIQRDSNTSEWEWVSNRKKKKFRWSLKPTRFTAQMLFNSVFFYSVTTFGKRKCGWLCCVALKKNI